MSRKRTVILISGRGSNMTALIAAAADPAFPAEIAGVISDRADAPGLGLAIARGVPVQVIADLKALWPLTGFRRLLTVRVVSQCADGMFTVGLATLFFFSPENAATAGAVAAAFAVLLLPFTIVGPWAGVLLDRWPRRQVLFVGNLVRTALTLVVALLMVTVGVGPAVYVLALATLSVNRFLLAALSVFTAWVAAMNLQPKPAVPVATANLGLTLKSNTELDVPLAGTDADGDALDFSVSRMPVHGTLEGIGNSLKYRPHPDFVGVDAFTFIVTDGVNISEAGSIKINVTAP